ncbi:hypothetical protein WG66_015400 [Moniliophthora roreri]|nr:hypothetical protein WG66_015400 [Moniliophthora roreri]
MKGSAPFFVEDAVRNSGLPLSPRNGASLGEGDILLGIDKAACGKDMPPISELGAESFPISIRRKC